MGVLEYVFVVSDVFGVVDEGDVGVFHDEFVVVEDVVDETDEFAAVGVEAGVKAVVDAHQSQQFRQFCLVAQ
jgi:hypothetical protein